VCDSESDIPVASTVQKHLSNRNYEGWVWALVDVDLTPFLGKSHKVNVTLPEGLLKRIDDVVARQPTYKTRSGFLAQAALHEMERRA
jgi:hypothetical protein